MKKCEVKAKKAGVFHVTKETGAVEQIKCKAGDSFVTDEGHAKVLMGQGLVEKPSAKAAEPVKIPDETPKRSKALKGAPRNKSK